jgi:hypothetical protein
MWRRFWRAGFELRKVNIFSRKLSTFASPQFFAEKTLKERVNKNLSLSSDSFSPILPIFLIKEFHHSHKKILVWTKSNLPENDKLLFTRS